MQAITEIQLKRQIKQACMATYGFAPAISDIVLEEFTRDGTYVRFYMKNGGQKYVFVCDICEGTIWCGKGTVTAV